MTLPADERLRRLRSTLAEHTPWTVPGPEKRVMAAVAVVLRVGKDGVEALLIQRAEKASDPWSGHMAFPGGRVESVDASPRDAAVRETLEEVALDLCQSADWLGRLSDARPRGRGRNLGMVIEPFVFAIGNEPVLRLGDEVQTVVWVPLRFLGERANRRSMWYWRAVVPVRLPCYRYQGHLIWGLTLRILDELVQLSET